MPKSSKRIQPDSSDIIKELEKKIGKRAKKLAQNTKTIASAKRACRTFASCVNFDNNNPQLDNSHFWSDQCEKHKILVEKLEKKQVKLALKLNMMIRNVQVDFCHKICGVIPEHYYNCRSCFTGGETSSPLLPNMPCFLCNPPFLINTHMVYVPGWWTYAGLYAEDIDLSYKYPLFNKPEYCQAEDIVRKRIAKLLPPGSDYAKQWNAIVSDAASHVKYAPSSDSSGNYKFSERED